MEQEDLRAKVNRINAILFQVGLTSVQVDTFWKKMKAEYFKRKKRQAICNAIGEMKKGNEAFANLAKNLGDSMSELNPVVKELSGRCYDLKSFPDKRNVVPPNFYKRCQK